MNEDTVQLEPVKPQTSGKATASLVLGLSSFLCWIVTGIPAVVLGIIALKDIRRSGGRLQGDGMAIAGIVTGGITSVLIVPVLILIALLLPAVQAAREAARRNVSMNNMKQISLGLLSYESARKNLPAAGGGEGPGSQLSWRVHILPFVEEQALYEQFHLDEPWDSEHNRALIARMPEIYKDPNFRLPEGMTSYLAVTGPGTFFGDGTTAPRIREITDGTANTFMIVEADADQAVVWTRPDDWDYDPNNPTHGLGAMRLGGFLAGTGDGALHFIQNDMPAHIIRAMMTRSGEENVNIHTGF
jgi:hypothetical protein